MIIVAKVMQNERITKHAVIFFFTLYLWAADNNAATNRKNMSREEPYHTESREQHNYIAQGTPDKHDKIRQERIIPHEAQRGKNSIT